MSEAMAWTRREVWTRKLLYPGHTLPTALAPILVAIGLALHDRMLSPAPVLLAFIADWRIQFTGVVTDNYTNLVRQPDGREHPELVEAVRTGLLSLPDLRMTILASYCTAVVLGVLLTLMAGWPVIVIGLASILASWAYSAGPPSVRPARLRRSFVLPVLRRRLGARRLLRAGGGGARAGALARRAAVDRGRDQPADRRPDHQHPDHR